ncbi:hypothetical protein EMIHUDRAFT_223998 [Emiliania huxleyi CCMP1516]|uniref:Uncharacterized protein n=2 Tax=Emiliania huxleyi TaxID=2903 RepID=A0A0D3KT01_EMIH1|nr:hypothetical protein EMIHUDRAFT_223998 [Emiliania huxleyi CCMP1516]EOD38886.1 hypothetical protein EMIHUDRAFT_223998 [Emiliania huxleyi CCMP1516]|eukprot:XP_005791315.1 hypothetical protein EMIHUDRAFT_223998 [Emiliania huxleyi CCMP1516]
MPAAAVSKIRGTSELDQYHMSENEALMVGIMSAEDGSIKVVISAPKSPPLLGAKTACGAKGVPITDGTAGSRTSAAVLDEGPGYVVGVEAEVRRLGESVVYQATPADGKKSPSPGVPTSGGIAPVAPKPLGAVAGAGQADAASREYYLAVRDKAMAAILLTKIQRAKLDAERSGCGCKCRRKAMRCRNNPKFGKAKGRRKRHSPLARAAPALAHAAPSLAHAAPAGGYTKAEGAFRWLLLVCMPAFGHCAPAVPSPAAVASAFSSAVASASSTFSSGVASAASSAFSPAVASKAASLVSCSPFLMPALVVILLAIACGASWPTAASGKGARRGVAWAVCVAAAAACLPGAAAAPVESRSQQCLTLFHVLR